MLVIHSYTIKVVSSRVTCEVFIYSERQYFGLVVALLDSWIVVIVGCNQVGNVMNLELSIKGKEEKLWSVHDNLTKEAGKKLDLYELLGLGDIAKLKFNRVVFWVQVFNAPLICMTKEMGEFLGSLIRDLVDIDIGVTGECFGKFMRLKVAIDVTKPLKRFLRLELQKGEESMLLLRYEKLPKFCFHYGVISHSYLECSIRKEDVRNDANTDLNFGPWFRASNPPGQNKGYVFQRYKSTGSSSRGGFVANHVQNGLQQMRSNNIVNEEGVLYELKDGRSTLLEERISVNGNITRWWKRSPLCWVCMKMGWHLQKYRTGEKVVRESRKNVGAVDINEGGSYLVHGSDSEIIKKNGKWKRWEREGGKREADTVGALQMEKKRLSSSDTGGCEQDVKRAKSSVAFDQELIEISKWNWNNKKELHEAVAEKRKILSQLLGAGVGVDVNWDQQREESSLHALWSCSSLKRIRSDSGISVDGRVLDQISFLDFCFLYLRSAVSSKGEMALKQPNTGLFVGLNKGHVVTKKELAPCPSNHKGKTSKRIHFVRNVIKEVASFAPYERRMTELLKVGKDKRALKVAKRKLGTHKRAKKKRDEMSNVLRKIRATEGGENKKAT
ncbi:hypothetical protein EZV62_004355 [Acer yangbiense]|uniref:60S ribosomal protein L36 n=1 Tax=Acer yangbiense TaxID=1000413 RepID=A0A5C7IJM1_9ROSI|nr:hypothetical protein EZV62_004355 [Acer yangbiense]